jgi:hypothetical protein
VSQSKYLYWSCLSSSESTKLVRCFARGCPFVVCRMSSEADVKSDRFKLKLQQFFVTCWFQFYDEVALFMIIILECEDHF